MKSFLEFASDNLIWIIIGTVLIFSAVTDCSKQNHEQTIREMVVKDSLEHLRD